MSGAGGAVLWDVDTQVDFVLSHGRLSVPGAEEVVPQMALLVDWARDAGVIHVASAGDHERQAGVRLTTTAEVVVGR